MGHLVYHWSPCPMTCLAASLGTLSQRTGEMRTSALCRLLFAMILARQSSRVLITAAGVPTALTGSCWIQRAARRPAPTCPIECVGADCAALIWTEISPACWLSDASQFLLSVLCSRVELEGGRIKGALLIRLWSASTLEPWGLWRTDAHLQTLITLVFVVTCSLKVDNVSKLAPLCQWRNP
jgi:hypothetical protein